MILVLPLSQKIPRKELKVAKIISHDVVLDLKNDIALLKLSEKVDLNTYTPVCVPNTGTDFTGKRAWTYGKKEYLFCIHTSMSI